MLLALPTSSASPVHLPPKLGTVHRCKGCSCKFVWGKAAASVLVARCFHQCRARCRCKPEVLDGSVEAWQWWGAKNREEWPELLETLVAEARVFLKEFFGHDSFRPEQLKVLRSALNRQDIEIYWPTAAGKSLIYQLVALLSWQRKRGIVIVVEPTIPVLQDQVQQFNARAESFCRSCGAEDTKFQACLLGSAQKDEKIMDQAVRGECCLVYLCPESLTQKYLEAFFHLRDSGRVSTFAVDEACYIPLWGDRFRPAFRDLAWLREAYPSVPILALSGTAPPKRQRCIRESLQLQKPLRSTRPMFRPNLQLQMHRCETDAKKLPKVLELLEKGVYPAVIYVPTKPDARRVRRRLEESLLDRNLDLKIGYMDGETSPTERASINLDFQSHRLDLMVATDAYGQGIDKPDIRLIVHWEPPVNFEMYVNHIGRAGRDGCTSHCVVLYSNSCWALRFDDGGYFTKAMEEMDEEDRQVEFDSRLTLKDMVTSKDMCRWQRLLRYYGCEDELPPEGCGSCDICLGHYDLESESADFTVGVQLLLRSLELASDLQHAPVDVMNLALGKEEVTGNLSRKQQELLQTIESLRFKMPQQQRQKGWFQELLNLLWTNNLVRRKYNGIHEVKLNRKNGRTRQELKFTWSVTERGHLAMKEETIRLVPSKRLLALDLGLAQHTRMEKKLSQAYQEFKRVDRSDEQARKDALEHIIKVLKETDGCASEKAAPRSKKLTRWLQQQQQQQQQPVPVEQSGNGWKQSYDVQDGLWHCTLTLSTLGVVKGTGCNKADSLNKALGQCKQQKFRINLGERQWVQKLLAELPVSPCDCDSYFEIVDVGHRRNTTVLMVVATLSFPSLKKSFRGNICELWSLALRSGVAAARKGLASIGRTAETSFV